MQSSASQEDSRSDEETPFSYATGRASQQDGGKLAGYVARLTFAARRTGTGASEQLATNCLSDDTFVDYKTLPGRFLRTTLPVCITALLHMSALSACVSSTI